MASHKNSEIKIRKTLKIRKAGAEYLASDPDNRWFAL